jgi:predicted negative regulator of RcsB-dependent stress response
MTEKKQPEPEKPGASHREDPELEVLRTFMTDYGKPGITAILAVAIVLTGSHMVRSHRASQVKRAAAALSTARSPTDLESIVADYGKTPSAPLALMAAAKAFYDTGNYDMAAGKYDALLANYGEHPMALAAALGKIHCLEARGDSASLTAAAADFAAFAAANPDSYLSPLAIFGNARCLQLSGDLAAAQQRYDEFLLKHPDGPWRTYAENQRETVDLEIKRARARILRPDAPPVLDVPVATAPVTPIPSAPVAAPVEVVSPAEAAAGAGDAIRIPVPAADHPPAMTPQPNADGEEKPGDPGAGDDAAGGM